MFCGGSRAVQIGVILRDSYGIAQVKSVTGNKILRLLKKNGERQILSKHGSCVTRNASNMREKGSSVVTIGVVLHIRVIPSYPMTLFVHRL